VAWAGYPSAGDLPDLFGSDALGVGDVLALPVTSRTMRSAARSAARRRRPARRRSLDWRLLGARLLLAVLVAIGAVVLAPELLPRATPATPTQHHVPSMPTGQDVVGPGPVLDVVLGGPTAEAPTAATAREAGVDPSR
jgi:hypothetical protein